MHRTQNTHIPHIFFLHYCDSFVKEIHIFDTAMKEFLLIVALVSAVHLCLGDSTPETPVDNPLLTREELTKLSDIRVRARASSIKARCELYASTLREQVSADLSTDKDLFDGVIEVLKRRKLPFGNPQPVLEDLQECVANIGLLESNQQTGSPRRDVIAGPPEKSGPSPKPKELENIENILDEHEAVKQRTVDQGQDIYYKPDAVDDNLRQDHVDTDSDNLLGNTDVGNPKEEVHSDDSHEEHDETHHGGEQNKLDDAFEGLKSVTEPDSADIEKPKDSADDELIEKLKLEVEHQTTLIESRESEIGSLQADLAHLETTLEALQHEQQESSHKAEEELEAMKELYEAALKREEKMKQMMENSSESKNENDKDDKKRVKDPASQAAILYDKLSAKDQPEDRCYKYYLLFTYPDKVVKKTIKTIAKLQVDLHDMAAFHLLVSPVFSIKLERILGQLAASKKKDVKLAAKEFEQCLSGLKDIEENIQPEEQVQEKRQNVFEVPVDFYPSRRRAQDNSYGQNYPSSSSGRIGRPVAVASATASLGRSFGVPDFSDMPPLEPSHIDFFAGRNPYIH